MFRIGLLALLVGVCYYSNVCSGLTDEEIALFKPKDPEFLERNTGLKSQVGVRDNGDGSLTVTTNGIPSHDTWVFPNPESGNPNDMTVVWSNIKVFKEPVMRTNGVMSCLPNGPIGISTSGVYIFSFWAAGKGCPYARDFEELDICEGHPAPSGHYHYHHYSPCVQMPVCGQESPIYGIALDGIPIYGPINDKGQQMTRADLDECGGRYDAEGRYKYHVTVDPPFYPSCFKGELRKDIGIPAQRFTCGCPYQDTQFPDLSDAKPEPSPTGEPDPAPEPAPGEPICDFSGDVNEPAVCNDKINATAAGLFTRKWIQVPQLVDLAPCCPPGADCGDSCKTEEGIKEVCVVGQRKIGVLTNVEKSRSCWEACYEECYNSGECGCKRRCKRRCMNQNGTSDKRMKREVELGMKEKRRCKDVRKSGA